MYFFLRIVHQCVPLLFVILLLKIVKALKMEVYPEIKSDFFIIIMSCTAREIRLLGKQAVLLHHTAAEYSMCLNPISSLHFSLLPRTT